jgi:hypothetical protein
MDESVKNERVILLLTFPFLHNSICLIPIEAEQ